MDNVERKNLKQALKIDIDSAYSYIRFALAGHKLGANEEDNKLQTKDSREWLVDSLSVLKRQIAEKCETFLKEIDDTIEKIS